MSNTIINTNVLALNSHRTLTQVGVQQTKASARLSSGLKINTGADDAAGLAISEKMRSQIRGLDMASKNSQDAISLIQTAEAGLSEITNMVQRIRELTVQAANESNQSSGDVGVPSHIFSGGAVSGNSNANKSDTIKLAKEASQLVREIDAMAARTEFNKKKLLVNSDGNLGLSNSNNSFHIQVGANANQSLNIMINHITAGTLSLINHDHTAGYHNAYWSDNGDRGASYFTNVSDSAVANRILKGGSAASAYLSTIDNALRVVSEERRCI